MSDWPVFPATTKNGLKLNFKYISCKMFVIKIEIAVIVNVEFQKKDLKVDEYTNVDVIFDAI